MLHSPRAFDITYGTGRPSIECCFYMLGSLFPESCSPQVYQFDPCYNFFMSIYSRLTIHDKTLSDRGLQNVSKLLRNMHLFMRFKLLLSIPYHTNSISRAERSH